MSDVTVGLNSNPVSVNFGNFDTVSGASALTVANRLVKVSSSGGITMATIAESGITGVLTLTKTGSTARTVTFPDEAIEVQATPTEQAANFTARNGASYVVTASCTVTDPTPVQGLGYEVLVRNGTATIGGTGYIAGQVIHRVYHSGAWSNTVQAALGTAQTFSALQTFSDGLTVSAGTTALQATTCTTLTASGAIASGTASVGNEYFTITADNTNFWTTLEAQKVGVEYSKIRLNPNGGAVTIGTDPGGSELLRVGGTARFNGTVVVGSGNLQVASGINYTGNVSGDLNSDTLILTSGGAVEANIEMYGTGSGLAGYIYYDALEHNFRNAAGGTTHARFTTSATAGDTHFMLYDVDNGTLERVTVGAADSGGTGFKVLRIPN